jgi:hypothetical protein
MLDWLKWALVIVALMIGTIFIATDEREVVCQPLSGMPYPASPCPTVDVWRWE